MFRVYHPEFDDFGTVQAITPNGNFLVRWDTRTVNRSTAELTPHQSHVCPRSVDII